MMHIAHHVRRLAVLAPSSLLICALAAAVPVEITYTDGANEGFNDSALGAARRNAFEAAVSRWATRLKGSQTIRITASFDPLGGTSSYAVLGQAGPNLYRDAPGLPLPGHWYAQALANQILDVDTAPSMEDIVAVFNSSVDGSALGSTKFYYGLDGAAGNDIDFFTVALHELCHGVGFISHAESTGSWLYGYPGVYDAFVARGSTAGSPRIETMSASARRSALISGALYFAGAAARTANDGESVRLYAPSPFAQGSSVSHLDEFTYQGVNELMTPIHSGPTHDPGPLVPEMLTDLGWVVNNPINALDQTVSTAVNAPVQITLEATGPPAAPLSYSIVTPPQRGALTGAGAMRTYTPEPGYQGVDSFTFQAEAGGDVSVPATVTINVGVPGTKGIVTEYATGVATNAAALRATVFPDGKATTAWFEWGETPALGNSTTARPMGSGTQPVALSEPLAHLTVAQTYYYRAVAAASGSTSRGDAKYFVTHVPVAGTALEFDGDGDTVEIDETDAPESFTVEMWVRPDTTADGQVFISRHTASRGRVFSLGYDRGGVYVRLAGLGAFGGAKTTDYQHLAVTVAKTGAATSQITVYRNGALLWQKSLASVAGTTPGGWSVGQEWNGATAGGFLRGQVDEVRLWSTVRSQKQIQDNVYRRIEGTESGLRVYLRLDDGSGVTPVDTRRGIPTLMHGLPRWVPSDAPIGIPLIATRAATNVTSSNARLNGTVNPNGQQTRYWFEWGTTPDLGNTTLVGDLPGGTAAQTVTANLTGLLSGTTYYARLVATNPRDTAQGESVAFTTVNVVTIPDVLLALRLAGGLEDADTSTLGRLDVVSAPPSNGRVDIMDAARLARKAAGLEPNP